MIVLWTGGIDRDHQYIATRAGQRLQRALPNDAIIQLACIGTCLDRADCMRQPADAAAGLQPTRRLSRRRAG